MPRVQVFLAKHRRVHMHYSPTYSSWLNQVENWFTRIQRDVITRGVFTSIKDLDKKLMRYIGQYNKDPKPLKWTFADPSRRIRFFGFSGLVASMSRVVCIQPEPGRPIRTVTAWVPPSSTRARVAPDRDGPPVAINVAGRSSFSSTVMWYVVSRKR